MRALSTFSDHYALFIGLRYSFSRKRSRFTGLIALVSMLGMVLGVASLITVLSVMNGFAGELRQRILSLVPHAYLESTTGGIADWPALAERVRQQSGVIAASPYISDKVIFSGPYLMHGGVLTAIDTATEGGVSRMPQSLVAGSLSALDDTPFSVVLGASLARQLGVMPGDSVEVTLPRITVTPLGAFPRSKRLQVVGLFEVGAQPDTYQAYVSLATGQKLFGEKGRVEGLQVKTEDLYRAPAIAAQLRPMLPQGIEVRDWSQTQGSLFRAVKMEKIMVSLLLLSVVAVAAFNIVSTLVMSVAEKRRDIAVLRTMGASARGVMAVFVAHGLGLALAGISLGALLGMLLASYIAPVTAFLEGLLGVKLFDPNVYFISELPSVLMGRDVVVVVLASLLLSLLATLYPAWRAAQVAPAEVLRYE
ncbi:lipoprotein-releasing ABC transporter permease subunit [Parahaliea mediterranea]|uniref:lipoprotein-releasing ABC transporter permease subunit n=1 Tax=Parahaliea mediterranea TaxID=651086 RepID=UPI001F4E553F|nr:lipoprotein-releasing ABC transporter permease subunit [Parahaliea mediterranea]